MLEHSSCPNCGHSLPLDPTQEANPIVFASEASRTIETLVPVTSHGDEDEPAATIAEERYTRLATPELALNPLLRDFECFPAGESGEFDPLASPVADPHLDVFASSSSEIPREDPASWPVEPVADRPPDSAPPEASTGAAGDEVERAPWLLMLLGSYASALTIAVAWLLWHGYGRGAGVKETLPTPTKSSPEARVRNLTPLGEDRRVSLGKTLAVGSLKVTPMSLTFGPVMLESARPDGSTDTSGAGHCYILTVRLENVSKDETFAPVERSAVRQRDSGESDSLIELPGSIIESYPLAIASERSIMGQPFGVLRPGESRNTILVSEPDAKSRLNGPAIWRLPVRVSEERTVTIGVEVTPNDVH